MNSSNLIETLIADNEEKTLEFKENCSSLANIVRTAVAFANNTFFDEYPCPGINSEDIDFRAASELFSKSGKTLSQGKIRSLGLNTNYGGKWVPTRGAVLLFGKNRASMFPHAQIRCARFDGNSPERFIDSLDIDEHLPIAVDTAITFVERNTRQRAEIGRLSRQETAEYPVQAVREAMFEK